jgi:hypothetical protein
MWNSFIGQRIAATTKALRRLGTILLRLEIKVRDLASRTRSYMRLHWSSTLMLAGGVVAITILVVFWSFWAREIPMQLTGLSRLILAFAHRHPRVSHILHVSLETVPDLAFVLLALAGLSYLMPELMQKLETNRTLRLSAFVMFLVFGVAAVILNAVNREDQENQRRIDRDKIDGLGSQVNTTLQFLVQSKGQPNELERRKHILDTLRSEYIVTHPEASAALIAGSADPPSEWMNEHLQKLGEQWEYIPPSLVVPILAPQPSYIVFDDAPKSGGGQAEGDPLAVGQQMGFNVHFKQQGPNPVELRRVSRWLYVERNFELSTQKALIGDFEERLRKDTSFFEASTLMPGDKRYLSAVGRNEDNSTRIITQTDLDNLRTGSEVIFVVAQIIYKYSGKEHHLRQCMFLQPPAGTPWVWGYCSGFTRSD